MTRAEAILLHNVSVNYGGICALDRVNLRVARGQFLAVVGPNGGGKSTLLKIIMGLLVPETGSVRVLGRQPQEARDKIGYVAQQRSFDLSCPVSVMEVVLMGRLPGRFRPGHRFSVRDCEAAELWLERLGIYQLRHRRLRELSGGQLQKVLLARALVKQPEILLLDEPTASIDYQAKNKLYELLHQLNQKLTIVLVTHDFGVVSAYADSIAYLNTTLHYSDSAEISRAELERTYGGPLELVLNHRGVLQHD